VQKTIIVGAGITGLVTAWKLKQAGQEPIVLEASSRPGGNINSQQHGEYLLECGPNTLLLNDTLYSVLDELALADKIKTAAPEAKYRFVLKKGGYRQLPSGPGSFLFGGFFSFGQKLRVWKERTLGAQGPEDESVDAFFRRRFGDAVADYVVAPFVSGVYAGDPKKLMARLAFPKLIKHEAEKGSVIKGMMASMKNRDEHRGIFSLEGGLQTLTDALAEKLGDSLRLNSPVESLRPEDQSWKVTLASGEALEAKQVISCVPSFTLGDMIAAWAREDAAKLRQVNYPAAAGVYTAYKKSQLGHRLNGFGALQNHIEASETLGTIFNSTVFPDRCPQDEVLLTTFVGGSRHPEKALLPKEEIAALAQLDHGRLLRAKGKPVFQHVVQWPRGIPQYDKDLLPALEVAEKLDKQGLIAAANWRGGISVPDCVKRGLELGNCED
jgi:oxygen-dependent protoporphyrinogen oxidase